MKKSMAFRAAGVAAALLIPVGGLTILGTGIAGAATATNLKVTFNFTSSSLTSAATCANTAVTVTGSAVSSSQTISCPTTTTAGTLTLGVTTSTLIVPATSVTRASTATHSGHLEMSTAVGFKLTLGSGTCTVHFNQPVYSSNTSHRRFTITPTGTAGNVNYTGTCSSVQSLLTSSSSQFTGTFIFTPTGL